jgi:hypothetical protein
MEPQCSLPCSQEPATGPYPEPDESTPHLPTLRFPLPNRSKQSVHVQESVKYFMTSWMTTLYRLSATAYSTHVKLSSTSASRLFHLLRTRHAVAIGTNTTIEMCSVRIPPASAVPISYSWNSKAPLRETKANLGMLQCNIATLIMERKTVPEKAYRY